MGWLIAALLLLLSLLMPLHIPPWVSWHSEVLTFLAVFLLAWTALRATYARRGSIQLPSLAVPFFLLALVGLVQVVTGVMNFWGDAFVVCLYVALAVVCLVLGFNAAQRVDKSDPRESPCQPALVLAVTLVVGSLACAVIAFAQVLELWEHAEWIARMNELRRPGANLGQPNQLATLLLTGMASTAFLHMAGRLRALPATLILLLLCVALAATESRTGVLAFAALLVWWQCKRRLLASGVPRWAGPSLGLVFLSLYAAWPHVLNAMQLLGRPAANRFVPGDMRLAVWLQMWEAIWQRPWWGWGILEVAEAHNAVAHAGTVSNPLSYSHNLVIDWAVWMGLPLALLLSAACVVWAWRRTREASNPTAWYCLAVFTPLAVHSMLEFPFAYAYFLAPSLFLVGLMEGARGGGTLLRLNTKVAGILLAGTSAALLWSTAEYVAIEEDFRIVRFEQLRIGRTPSDHQPPDIILLTQLGALLKGSRLELRSGMPPAEIEQLRKLALRYPWVATQYRYALALALNENQQEARRQFQVIRKQQDEKLYRQIKTQISELAHSRHPQLIDFSLP